MTSLEIKRMLAFLKRNKVAFEMNENYHLSWSIIERALNDFFEKGNSDLLKKHHDWTYGCWELECAKKYNLIIPQSNYSNLKIKDMKNLLKLKEFWKDESEIDFLLLLIKQEQNRLRISKTYKFKRTSGFGKTLKYQCLNRDEMKCVKCKSSKKLQVDHIKPLFLGGTNKISNLQTLCTPCHLIKTKEELKNRYKIKN